MNRNLLGHQIQTWTPDAIATVYRAPGHVLKLIGTAALDWSLIHWWRAQRPEGLLIYRPFWAYQNLYNPRQQAHWAVGPLGPNLRLFDYIEGPNEEWQDEKWLPRYNAYSVEYGDELHRIGTKYLCGSFSRGNLALHLLHLYADAMRQADALGTHEYGYPDSPGDLGRYTLVLEVLASLGIDTPLLISEMGSIDDDRSGGWRKYQSPQQMASTLLQYAQKTALEKKILGIATFVTGTWHQQGNGSPGQFTSFELAGCPEYEQVVNTPIEGEETMPETQDPWTKYPVGPGIRDAMKELGDEPRSSETDGWVGHLGSYVQGKYNRYHYNKEQGQVYVSYPLARGG